MTIDNEAFFGCTALASVTIPDSVVTIGHSVFYGCTALETVTIPDFVETIGYKAFQGCTALETMTIPDSVLTIGHRIFYGCSSLETVIIGNSIQIIADYALYGCTALTSVTIPASVTSIGGSTFYSTSADLVITMDTQTIDGNEYTSPTTTDVSFFGNTSVTFIVLTPPPDPTCFPAGTPVQTDQGETVIEKLVPGEHTLRGKSIPAITQTRPLQKHIVCFEKDSIGKNVPSQQTLCSKEHRVLYRGEMIKARDLADMCKNVKKVSYNREPLYNVLLEKHGKMLVNNMICETLHPENIAAKFAKTKNSPEKRMLTREMSHVFNKTLSTKR